MTPQIRHVTPDGIEIRTPGAKPLRGGSRGAPAFDVNGNPRCVDCLTLLPSESGRSPYCENCRRAAVKQAWQKRNDARRSAAASRRELRQDSRWEGPGYTHGRAGLYIDADLLGDLREALSGLLSAHATWGHLGAEPFTPDHARQYQRALKDLLESVYDANLSLRGPFWPRTDHASRRQGQPPPSRENPRNPS